MEVLRQMSGHYACVKISVLIKRGEGGSEKQRLWNSCAGKKRKLAGERKRGSSHVSGPILVANIRSGVGIDLKLLEKTTDKTLGSRRGGSRRAA